MSTVEQWAARVAQVESAYTTIDNIKVEVSTVKECAKYLGQTNTFEQQRQQKSRVESEELGHHLPSIDWS